MSLKIGSLFSGYGGLDLAVSEVTGGEVVWHCEWDDAPSKILERNFPGVPNYRDVSKVDWDSVEPVDILTGGFPCQDLSLAGKRAGLKEGTRSGLWNSYADAIEHLSPSLVVIENVRGLLSSPAHGDVEHCAWCLGDDAGEPSLRALGAVLGDLADLGFDAEWAGIRASDVGAPHSRFRVFIVAYPSSKRNGGGRDAPARRKSWGKQSQVEISTIGGVRPHIPETWDASQIDKWERVVGRRCPEPVVGGEVNSKFYEWMMGLPDGWVTDCGLSRKEELMACGNGVIPQQAAKAIRMMLEVAA